jgi:uncharacterized protein YbjQ (UPF0145 family)
LPAGCLQEDDGQREIEPGSYLEALAKTDFHLHNPSSSPDRSAIVSQLPLADGRRKPENAATRNASQEQEQTMIVTTGNDVAGHVIRDYLGVVRGIVVRSPSITQGFLGGLKQMVGGNIESYAEVCETARREAFNRMVKHADEIDADAVIAMRYDATEFTPNVTEVLAYGTAVKLSRG